MSEQHTVEHHSRVKGRFIIVHRDADGVLLDRWEVENGATTEGLNYLLNAGFRGSAQIGEWYLGLIDGAGYNAVSASDTAAGHGGWTESIAYSGDRKTWAKNAAASGVLASSGSATFTMSADGTIRGLGVYSDAIKGGISGRVVGHRHRHGQSPGTESAVAAGLLFDHFDPEQLMARIKLCGVMRLTHRDSAGAVLWTQRVDNAVTTDGLTHLLGVGFPSGAGAVQLVGRPHRRPGVHPDAGRRPA